jgi:EmrB/QacA subfamily drug resistance transporter
MMIPNSSIPSREHRSATLLMACLGAFVGYLPVTTVAVSLPTIQRALHATSAQLTWVQDAFVLTVAALILSAGAVGDVHGRRKVFQAGLILAGAGATISLCAHSVQVVWIGQALAGFGASALMPTSLALISHAVPDPRERSKFVGLWAISLLAALAVGPLIAGAILQHAGWRWIFLPGVPASLAALAASGLVADSKAPGARRLDWPGQVAAALTVSALVYGAIEGGAGSFSSGRVITAFALALAGAVAFIVIERRVSSPMLDLKVFRSPAFSATAVIAMVAFLGLIGVVFVLSLYFGMVQQLNALQAGERLLPTTLAAIAVSVPAARLMHRVTPRMLITAGLLVMAGSLLSLTSIDAHTTAGPLMWRLALLGVGVGAVVTPMTAVAVASVPHQLAGMAAAGNSAFRQVGGALGPAILGALLTTRTIHQLPGHLTSNGVSTATANGVVAAAHAGGPGAAAQVQAGAQQGQVFQALSASLVDAVHLCLVTGAALALLAAVAAVGLLRSPHSSGSARADDQRQGRHRAEHGLDAADPTPVQTP